ncbi:MAG: MBL fold metallo-hydrolase [Elusimicrobiota bacterium]
MATNCYIVYEDKVAVIDPGFNPKKIISVIEEISLPLTHILYTHAHIDHIGAGAELKEYSGAKVVMGKKDIQTIKDKQKNLQDWIEYECGPAQPDMLVKEGDTINVGKIKFNILETPGHSPGSISYFTNGFLFSGDLIFFNSVGRTDLPGGNQDELIKSIEQKVFSLDDNIKIYPGHGPQTTVKWEKENNPYIN